MNPAKYIFTEIAKKIILFLKKQFSCFCRNQNKTEFFIPVSADTEAVSVDIYYLYIK